jgi:hypothetical protein
MRRITGGMAVACAIALAAAFIAGTSAQNAPAIEETAESLPEFKGRDETFGYCIGCHSFKVVGRQGMDRARWDETLRFMTERHGMLAPDEDTRKLLLDYLTHAFPATAPAQTGGWVSPFAPSK